MSRKSMKTTLEKFKKARKEYEDGVYDTIEQSAKANGMSPANYYIYAKKITPEIEKRAADISLDLPKEDRSISEIIKSIQSLQGQIEKLKGKLVDALLTKV